MRRGRKMGRRVIRNRVALHLESRCRVAAKLKRAGLKVKPQTPWGQPWHKFDLLINSAVRVLLKSAAAHWSQHAVVSRGRHYNYRYLTWHFNFHRHGRMPERYADFIICVARGSRGNKRSADDYFIIPWEAITGKTFAFHRASAPYSGHYAAYRNNWEPLFKAVTKHQAPVAVTASTAVA